MDLSFDCVISRVQRAIFRLFPICRGAVLNKQKCKTKWSLWWQNKYIRLTQMPQQHLNSQTGKVCKYEEIKNGIHSLLSMRHIAHQQEFGCTKCHLVFKGFFKRSHQGFSWLKTGLRWWLRVTVTTVGLAWLPLFMQDLEMPNHQRTRKACHFPLFFLMH